MKNAVFNLERSHSIARRRVEGLQVAGAQAVLGRRKNLAAGRVYMMAAKMAKRKLFLVVVILLSACAAPAPAATPVLPAPVETPLPASPATSAPSTPASPSTQTTLAPTVSPAATNVRVTDTNEYAFPQLIPFDGIPPVYDPQFASAADAPLLDDELVMGIALDGEAKAYPVTVLRFREMVDDELAGTPILVTW